MPYKSKIMYTPDDQDAVMVVILSREKTGEFTMTVMRYDFLHQFTFNDEAEALAVYSVWKDLFAMEEYVTPH